jgi:ferrochelatase
MEVRTAFIEEGGSEFHYIPCLNANPAWIDALCGLVMQHTQGWPLGQADATSLQASREHALALGAKD